MAYPQLLLKDDFPIGRIIPFPNAGLAAALIAGNRIGIYDTIDNLSCRYRLFAREASFDPVKSKITYYSTYENLGNSL